MTVTSLQMKTQVTELADENFVTTITIAFLVVKMWKDSTGYRNLMKLTKVTPTPQINQLTKPNQIKTNIKIKT